MAGLDPKLETGVFQYEKYAAGKRILIVATSHDKLGNTGQPTGCWAEELAAPYYTCKDAGADVVIASLKGGKIPMDEASFGENFVTDHVKRYLTDEELKKYVDNSIPIKDVPYNFHAVFIPGGHGIVFDGPNDEHLKALCEKFLATGKIIGAVCHGPAALVNVCEPNGTNVFKGKRCCGFTNSEEEAVGKGASLPFLLEDKLKELGGLYEKQPNWEPKVVADGSLVLGQNPASSAYTAELILNRI